MNVGPGLPSRLPPHPPNPVLIPAYSLIVAGPASVAKSALLRLLLHTAPAASRPPSTPPLLPASDPHHPFPECDLDVLWHGDRLLLRLIDSPPLDFAPGAEDDLERAIRDILHFVESRYVEGARDESTVGESHVHLCLYVLDPTIIGPRSPHSYRRHSPASPHSASSATSPPANASTAAIITALPPAEIAAIRRLSARVNVLPILGRADAVPLARLTEIKHAVRRDLADAGLGFGIFDDGADAPTAFDDATPLPLLPYAVFAPDSFPPSLSPPPSPGPLPSDDDARIATLQGRFLSRFRWGVLDALDPRNSDFVALRRATMNHHKVLKKYTKDYLYEKFKVDSILAVQQQQQQKSHQQASRVHPGSVHALLNHHHRHDHRDPPPPQSHLPPAPEHEYAPRNPAGLSPPIHAAHATRLPPVVYDRDDEDQRGVHRERERDDVQQPQPREVGMPDETVTGRKRKIPMACSFCRSRKLKCDGVRPACAQCVKRSNKCDYQPHSAAHAHGGQTQTTTWKYKRAPAAAAGANSHYPHHAPQAGERHHHAQEDVDELDEEGVSSASEGGGYLHHTQAAAAAQHHQQHQQNYQTQGGQRKRVSVDMLIAATLDHPASAAAAAAAAAAATTPPHSTAPATAAQWYEGGGAGGNGASGMGVLDVGSEGDKKKRLNRQSANYGSKAVACVHCRARKTRCDAARPECGNCSRRALVCSYVHTQPSQPRSKGKKAAAAAAAAAAATTATTAATTNGTNTPATKLESTSPPATTFHHPHPHAHAHQAQQQQRSPPPGGATTPPAGTGATKWARSSPPMGMSVSVPVPVDSALEESAERERPRSPPPPSARAEARTPPEQHQRGRSLTPASAAASASAGTKRTRTASPERGGGSGGEDRGPVEKRMKWDSSSAAAAAAAAASGDVGGGVGGGVVGVGVAAEAVRV